MLKYVKMRVYCYKSTSTNDQKWPAPEPKKNSEGIWSPTPMPLQVPFGDFGLGAKGVPVFLLAVALWALKIDLATEVLPGRGGNVEMCLKMILPSRQFLILYIFREPGSLGKWWMTAGITSPGGHRAVSSMWLGAHEGSYFDKKPNTFLGSGTFCSVREGPRNCHGELL